MHLEFNKMRQEMRDLINEKAVNENWLKEMQELREEVQMSNKKKFKRSNSNKDSHKDLKYGSVKSKESPRKRINFLEEESTTTSNSSRKGYVYNVLYLINSIRVNTDCQVQIFDRIRTSLTICYLERLNALKSKKITNRTSRQRRIYILNTTR
jgi:hypothetical protein